ncbi:1,3-beta-glucanosyltransferase gel4 [Smittium mucronatum]|uniref:1,3-beta-glucanosyltransferase n=1 Tax=Smittium mucronatum TaxID=133383 RepID=A0A1R0H4W5_9FUNG|nr:1,3-beta-glucanosyltransferase gel4 [Smittium mucronatum]
MTLNILLKLFAVFYILVSPILVSSIDNLVIKGSKFFNGRTGNQFFFKGISYQPRSFDLGNNPDPLALETQCLRDIEYFKELRINTIRVYETDYNLNHDVCMEALEDAGIYVLLDIPSKSYSINRVSPSWDTYLYENFKKKIDAFNKYPNVAGYLIGNEVITGNDTTPSAAFVKASVRDMKLYMKEKRYESYIGYADIDKDSVRINDSRYFDCGNDTNSKIDFYGINTFRWCDNNLTYTTSGYLNISESYSNYDIPVLVSALGCVPEDGREFNDLKTILGPNMTDVFSGGIAYEYSNEAGFGIVDIENGLVTKKPDFEYLKEALDLNPKNDLKLTTFRESKNASTCPSVSSDWRVNSRSLPPTPQKNFCDCVYWSLKCLVGTKDIPRDELDRELERIVNYICDSMNCGFITSNTVDGYYGPISSCSPNIRAKYIINKYFIFNDEDPSYCSYPTIGSIIIDKTKVSNVNQCKNTTLPNQEDPGDQVIIIENSNPSLSKKQLGRNPIAKNKPENQVIKIESESSDVFDLISSPLINLRHNSLYRSRNLVKRNGSHINGIFLHLIILTVTVAILFNLY